MLSATWVSGTSELVSVEEDRFCLTNFRPIHTPAMRTQGMPIPSPTPRPSLTVSVLGLALVGDGGEGLVEVVSEILCEGILDIEFAIVLIIEEVNDIEAADEPMLDEV